MNGPQSENPDCQQIKSEVVSVRFERGALDSLRAAAQTSDRTTGGMLRHIVRTWAANNSNGNLNGRTQ